MLSIQEVGTEIFSKSPRKLYIMVGEEYGIKCRYIDMLAKIYGQVKPVSKMSDLLSMSSVKHIVPLRPSLYVIRYDEEFISSLSEKTKHIIDSCNLAGTAVLLYDDAKSSAKLEKYLPDYSVNVGSVDPKFIFKYLRQEFSSLDDRCISLASKICKNYGHARMICLSMNNVDRNILADMPDSEIEFLLGHNNLSTESMIKLGVASRNFKYLLNVWETYSDDSDIFIYTILATLLEIEKLLWNKHIESPIRAYIKNWTLEDVYNMFMNSYFSLKQLRTSSATSTENVVIYLISLLQFLKIPALEDIVC